MKTLMILGIEYFDKVNGNSYHTSEVFFDNVNFKSGIEYGYGDQYIDTAIRLLQNNDYFKDMITYENGIQEPLYKYCGRNNIKLFSRKIRVSAKKQLTNKGVWSIWFKPEFC